MKTILLILLVVIPVFAQSELESNDFSYPLKLYNQEFYDLAAKQFVKFYSNYPNSAKLDQAYYFAAMSYFQLKDYDKAKMEFQSLAVGFPKSDKAAESWLKTGVCSERLNELEDAAKSFETIRLLYPKDPLAPDGLFRAGNLYLKLDEYNQAFQAFGTIIERYSASSFYSPAQVKSALCLYNQEELEKADQIITKAMQSDATTEETLAEAYLIAAKIKLRQGNFNKAKEYLEHLIKFYPKTVFSQEGLVQLSTLYISENNYAGAEKLLDAVKVSDAKSQLSTLQGDIFFLQNKFKRAKNKYSQIESQQADVHFLTIEFKKSLCEYRLNNRDLAIQILKGAIDKTPSTVSLYSRVDSVYMSWLENSGRLSELISKLSTDRGSLNNQVKFARSTIKLARILRKENRWREIIAELQPLTLMQESYSSKDEVFYYLAEAYEKTENYRDAVYYYQKFISEFGGSFLYPLAIANLDYLNKHKILNTDLAIEKLANITAALVNEFDKTELQLSLGKIYLSDLKKLAQAESQFKLLLRDSTSYTGDAHLLLGKTYLFMSRENQETEESVTRYQTLAAEQFKLALQNSNTCQSPDEASWLMVQSLFMTDSVNTRRQKNILEGLIKKYPNSDYQEEWYKNLAYTLAFDTLFTNESIKYFNYLIQNYPESESFPEYLFSYSQFLQETEPEKAISLYKKVALEYPMSHQAASALLAVADNYEQNEQYREVDVLYARLLHQYFYSPQAVDVKKNMGAVFLKAGKYAEAAVYLEEISTDPFMKDLIFQKLFLTDDDLEQLYYLARAYDGLNKNSLAIVTYKQYLNLSINGNNRYDAQLRLGENFHSLNQKEAAVKYFQMIPSQVTDLYIQARIYLAEIYFEQGQYPKAAVEYQRVETKTSDKEKIEDISIKYIVSLIRAGQLKESSKEISKHKKQFPSSINNQARFAVELADYYRKEKNYTKATNLLTQVKKKYKTSDFLDDADYLIALIHITNNRIEEAFKILSKFYTNYPNSDKLASALNTLGNLYFRTEKYDNAITMFKNALKAKHDLELERNIKSNLIKTYALTGFWDAAQAMAREYVEKFPGASDLLDKKIVISQAFVNLNQFQNAVDYLKKIKLEADAEREPEIQFYIGEALLKSGQYENAIAEFVKIPLLSKKTKLQWEASALYYSGQSYEKLGRTNDAVRMYREIIQRPGIDLILKKEAEKRIQQIQ